MTAMEDDEQKKILRNIREMDELACRQKRASGFPCGKETCNEFGTPRCLHPEKAGFPAKRY